MKVKTEVIIEAEVEIDGEVIDNFVEQYFIGEDNERNKRLKKDENFKKGLTMNILRLYIEHQSLLQSDNELYWDGVCKIDGEKISDLEIKEDD